MSDLIDYIKKFMEDRTNSELERGIVIGKSIENFSLYIGRVMGEYGIIIANDRAVSNTINDLFKKLNKPYENLSSEEGILYKFKYEPEIVSKLLEKLLYYVTDNPSFYKEVKTVVNGKTLNRYILIPAES